MSKNGEGLALPRYYFYYVYVAWFGGGGPGMQPLQEDMVGKED